MNNHATPCHAAGETTTGSLVRRFRKWLRSGDADERYLADAVDLGDLERRMRALERARGGPQFVTFNH